MMNNEQQSPDVPLIPSARDSAQAIAADNAWQFNLDAWTLGEDALYLMQVDRAQRSGDYYRLFGHWARMIRAWPFKLDPSRLRDYDALGENVYYEIIDRINREIRAPKRFDSRLGGAEW